MAKKLKKGIAGLAKDLGKSIGRDRGGDIGPMLRDDCAAALKEELPKLTDRDLDVFVPICLKAALEEIKIWG